MATNWQEAKQKSIDEFNNSMKTTWTASQEYWKHLVMVEATVLGLTVGLFGGVGLAAPTPLVLSWVFLLFAIATGCLLVKIAIATAFDGAIRGFRLAADIADIMSRVQEGTLKDGSEEYRNLFIAASVRGTPDNAKPYPWTPQAKKIAAEHEHLLATNYLDVPKRTALVRWLHVRWAGIESCFYALSALAFAFLLAAVISPGLLPVRAVGSQGQSPTPAHRAVSPPDLRAARPSGTPSTAATPTPAPDSSNPARSRH